MEPPSSQRSLWHPGRPDTSSQARPGFLHRLIPYGGRPRRKFLAHEF